MSRTIVSFTVTFLLCILLISSLLFNTCQADFTITTLAGYNPYESGTPLAEALFYGPIVVQVTPYGVIYLIDNYNSNYQVKKISKGIVYHVAGAFSNGYVDGSTSKAVFLNPLSMAVTDDESKIYIAEVISGLSIRMISNGQVTTIAGTRSSSGLVSGSALDTYLNPRAIAIHSEANELYIASDTYIKKLNLNTLQVSIVAGSSTTSGYSGDGGLATAAKLTTTTGIALSTSGTTLNAVYVSDNTICRLRKIDSKGVINTVVGTSSCGSSVDGLLANSTMISSIQTLGLSPVSNEIYYMERGNIRKVLNSNNSVFSIVSKTNGFSGDGGQSVNAKLSNDLIGMAFDKSGNLYIADKGNYRIRMISPSGIISTFAGMDASTLGENNRMATKTFFNTESLGPTTVRSQGEIYFVHGGSRIRKIALNGTIQAVAGTSTTGDSGDGSLALNALLTDIVDMKFNSQNELIISDRSAKRIRKIDKNGIIKTIAGTGVYGQVSYGIANKTSLMGPGQFSIDLKTDDIYLVDNNVIRKIVNSTGEMIVLAGNFGSYSSESSADGNYANGTIIAPYGILYLDFDSSTKYTQFSSGDILFSEQAKIRVISKETGLLSSIPVPTAYKVGSLVSNSKGVVYYVINGKVQRLSGSTIESLTDGSNLVKSITLSKDEKSIFFTSTDLVLSVSNIYTEPSSPATPSSSIFLNPKTSSSTMAKNSNIHIGSTTNDLVYLSLLSLLIILVVAIVIVVIVIVVVCVKKKQQHSGGSSRSIEMRTV